MRNDYSIFYSYKGIGDVLIVIFGNDKKATHSERKGQVEVIYNNDEVIGYNIFDISKIIKIKTSGLIYLPSKELISIVNAVLKNNGVEELEVQTNSGYIIGKVLDIKPYQEKKIVSVDIASEVVKAYTKEEVNLNDIVVMATLGTRLNDGRIVKQLEGTNAFICTEKDLQISEDNKILLLETEEDIGKDFFTIE